MKKRFEGVTAITCKDGITTVEFEKEVNQQAEEETKSIKEQCPDNEWPKPGDFVHMFAMTRSGGPTDMEAIAIFKSGAGRLGDRVELFVVLSKDGTIFQDASFERYGLTVATPSEQKMLEDALLKVGKVWNPDTQKIERWRAEMGGSYICICIEGCEEFLDRQDNFDDRVFEVGNYFHPSEDTSEYEKAYRDIFKNRLI